MVSKSLLGIFDSGLGQPCGQKEIELESGKKLPDDNLLQEKERQENKWNFLLIS